LFTDYEQRLFTRVVAVAERHGRTVKLLVVPAANVFDALVQTAVQLRSSEVVVGESAKLTAADQAHYLGAAWDRSAKHAPVATRLVVIAADGRSQTFSLGAHAPQLADAGRRADPHALARCRGPSRSGRPPSRHRVGRPQQLTKREFRRDDARAVARLRQSRMKAMAMAAAMLVGAAEQSAAQTQADAATVRYGAFIDAACLGDSENPPNHTFRLSLVRTPRVDECVVDMAAAWSEQAGH
jgi:hypothetical protein